MTFSQTVIFHQVQQRVQRHQESLTVGKLAETVSIQPLITGEAMKRRFQHSCAFPRFNHAERVEVREHFLEFFEQPDD